MSELVSRLSRFAAGTIALAPGASLFRNGAPIHWLFQVDEGLVHLVRYRAEGAATVMQRVGAGEIIAEASLFESSYHCDAVTVLPTRLRRVAISDLRRAMAEEPDFALAYARHLAKEVRRMRVRAEILAMRTVAARLDAWLSENPLPPRGAWTTLADDIGVSREALYRALARRRSVRPRNVGSPTDRPDCLC